MNRSTEQGDALRAEDPFFHPWRWEPVDRDTAVAICPWEGVLAVTCLQGARQQGQWFDERHPLYADAARHELLQVRYFRYRGSGDGTGWGVAPGPARAEEQQAQQPPPAATRQKARRTRVRLRFLDADTDEELQGVELALRSADQPDRRATTDIKGQAEVPEVPADTRFSVSFPSLSRKPGKREPS